MLVLLFLEGLLMVASYFTGFKDILSNIHITVSDIDSKIKLFISSFLFFLTQLSYPCIANDNIFIVDNIIVDERAYTSSLARTEGIEKAQERALYELFMRLIPSDYYDKLPILSRKDAIDHVKDFSVYDEKTSTNRYSANLIVRFHPENVRTTLRFSNIPFAEVKSKPALIIPVYSPSPESDRVLWATPNPWRKAWDGYYEKDGLLEKILPFGDLKDMSELTIEDISVSDFERITNWAKRYNTDNIIITYGYILPDGVNSSLRVELYFLLDLYQLVFDVELEDNADADEMFNIAVKKALESIKDRWKNNNILQYNISGDILVSIPIGSLEDWVYLEKRIKNVPLVDDVFTRSITKNLVEITIKFLGNQDQLMLALSQNEIELLWSNSKWLLRERNN